MAIAYPLALPTVTVAKEIAFSAHSVVGLNASPFTGEQQVYAHQGEWWEAQVTLPPMKRAAAEAWVAFLLALNGREGTFAMGDPANPDLSGGVLGNVVRVQGGGQTGKTLNTRDWSPGVTGIMRAGDWFQLGSGASSRLHKCVQDVDSAAGSPGAGLATIEFWPRLRSSPSDGDVVTTSGAQGIWRLASNRRDWSIGEAHVYGVQFACIEAL